MFSINALNIIITKVWEFSSIYINKLRFLVLIIENKIFLLEVSFKFSNNQKLDFMPFYLYAIYLIALINF